MPKPWVYGLKLLTTLALFIGFAFFIIEQRLESKTYEMQIRSLQGTLSDMRMKKRDLLMKIDSEMQRLSSYDYESVGTPVSMKDVILVPVKPDGQNQAPAPSGFGNEETSIALRELLARIPSELPFFRK